MGLAKARPRTETLDTRLAKRLASARAVRGQTLDELAQASGVSRAMISKIERGESSPTAMVLGKLAGGLGVKLSSLFAEVEGRTVEPVARSDRQAVWRDPETGYLRRDVAPPGTGSPQDIVRVELPAGARVAYPASTYANRDHHILLLSGRLRFGNGTRVFDLEAGDCLWLPEVADSWYFNPGPDAAEYLVMIVRLPGFGRA
jgi:transcriptional regulator with XRE-family HTH domain